MRTLTGLGARCGKIKTYHIAPLYDFQENVLDSRRIYEIIVISECEIYCPL